MDDEYVSHSYFGKSWTTKRGIKLLNEREQTISQCYV